jgi:hypothetical protein
MSLVLGRSIGPRAWAFGALALLVASNAACDAETKPGELELRVSFVCEEDRTQSRQLQLRVLAEGCGPDAEALYEAMLGHGETAPPVDRVQPGRYGVEATAYGDEEAALARTCLEVNLPRVEAIALELRSAACTEAALDADVPLDAQLDAAAEEDALSTDLDAEAGADAGDAAVEPDADAAPSVCNSDCSDSDPCTDDVCVAGACTHPAFSGARECDGIACTQGDMCVAGECQPGAPNHAACADDGNPCSAETCVAGAGCNRSNAGADGRSCDDNIACTSGDSCNNGVCGGDDTCPGGQVCSAAQRICLSCSGPQDCDDGNPCTTDTCSTGQCGHGNNTAGCDDGKSCTSNDVCAAGSCAGTSTCPGDASCGGSTCACNDAGETLCTASNTCVNLTNTASDCGLCGRACGAGNSCQNGACKPSGATQCTAYRSGGHDYLVCSDTLIWTAARDRCRSFGLVLGIVDSQSENDFLRDRLGGTPHWIGASDRGDEGSNCRLSREEGTWYWANGSSDNGTKLCTATASGAVACALEPGRYHNFRSDQPNNIYCNTPCGGTCSEGQDCASMQPAGEWFDDQCSLALGYVCETP